MKRRINSTERKRIRRENLAISMFEAEIGQPLKATASLDISNSDFSDTNGKTRNCQISSELIHINPLQAGPAI
jgi:hypothetical protein